MVDILCRELGIKFTVPPAVVTFGSVDVLTEVVLAAPTGNMGDPEVLALLAAGIGVCCACAKVETAAKIHTAPRSPIPRLAMVALLMIFFGSEWEDKFGGFYSRRLRAAIKKRTVQRF